MMPKVIYQGTLVAKRTTKKMVVYGNEDLHAQYLPKAMFGKRGKPHPPQLDFSITAPEIADKPPKKQKGASAA